MRRQSHWRAKSGGSVGSAAAAALACLLIFCLARASSLPPPTIISPTNGQRIGTSVDVIGKTQGKQFVVILTDVYVGTRLIGTVPGHRHWTDEAGNFKLRIAAPQVANADQKDVRYKIRVFTANKAGAKSPESVVICYPR
jgi:hypothetical protein